MKQEYVTQRQLQKLISVQEEMSQHGKPVSLEEVMVNSGLITTENIKEIYQKIGEEIASRTEQYVSGESNTFTLSAKDSSASLADKTDVIDPGMPETKESPTWPLGKGRKTEKLEKIGRYRIMSQLGAGGMGVVYKAEDEMLKRCVALKVLLESSTNQVQNERFLLEAQATAKLNHPNIVAVYDIGQIEQDKFYLVMEYIEGTSLKDVITEKAPFKISEAIELTRQVSSALHAAHTLNIVHRDIKPANILITKAGMAKVTDFGLAKIITGASLSISGQILGTPYYISPEQVEGKKVDGRADIYALGITFYQMLTNKLPFHGEDVYTLLFARLKQDPQPVESHRPEIPAPLSKIVSKMIARDRENRFATGEDRKSVV